MALTPTELNALGAALVGGDLVAELEAIVNERTRAAVTPVQDELMLMNRWSNALADQIPDGDESRLSNPEGAQEGIVLDCLTAYVRQLAAVRAYADVLLDSADPGDRLTAETLFQMLEVAR